MLELMARAHTIELELRTRELNQRREWQHTQLVDRLERRLTTARGVLRVLPAS